MTDAIQPNWSRPTTILFAVEVPANEKAFAFALAQAVEFRAELVLFHAYDTLVVSASETSGVCYYDYAAAARIDREALEPMAQRVRAAGVRCEVVARPGLPADQILKFLSEHTVDRVVMGTHSPGPIGKLLVGSVAEAVLRSSPVPVFVVGPEIVEATYRRFATHTILCAVSLYESSHAVVEFASALALQHQARLILQHVIHERDRHDETDGRSIAQIEGELLSLVPSEMLGRLVIEPVVVSGDATDELLFQARAQLADLIVLGVQSASAFTALARSGVAYKLLAHAECPVLTLSPNAVGDGGGPSKKHEREEFLAGVF